MRLDDIVGSTIREVTYYVLPDLADPAYIRYPHVHDVSMGIELHTDDRRAFTISWRTQDYDARVEVTAGPVSERFPHGSDLVPVAAGEWPEWRQLLGRTVSGAQDRQGLKPLESGLTRVGLCLRFDGDLDGDADGESVTVALGEVDDDGTPRYSPDNLVVFFDERAAQEYTAALAESA